MTNLKVLAELAAGAERGGEGGISSSLIAPKMDD